MFEPALSRLHAAAVHSPQTLGRMNAQTARLRLEPLAESHLDELASVILHPLVYEHIEDHVPPLEEFKLGLARAIAGPGQNNDGQVWLNYLVRHGDTGAMLGRLESTLHDSIAEVAFLFGPEHWGKGYACEGLAWLHAEIARQHAITSFWGTTVPANGRCQALLRRSGYSQVHGPLPALLSYAPGDFVFQFSHAA